MLKRLKIVFSLLCVAFLLTCSTCFGPIEESAYVEWGLKPIYSNELADVFEILDSQPLINPGKIYVYQDMLLVNEQQRGLHVFNNSDPRNPEKLFFISILGNNDMAVRNDILYADQNNNLLAIDLASILSENLLVTRTENIIDSYSLFYDQVNYEPNENNVFYECPNPILGRVVEWELDSILNPCYK